MPSALIEKLLILQDRDTLCLDLEKQLAALPGEVASVEAAIAAEASAIETARGELKALDVRRKLLETESGSATEKLAKYRTQQAQVKKNDEYQALGQTIAAAEARVSDLEEQAITLLYEVDAAKERFVQAEEASKKTIAAHRERIAMLGERQKNLGAELEAAKASAAAAREPIAEPVLRVYERVAGRYRPTVVPVINGKCDGCHLRIASETDAGVPAIDGEKLRLCDQCGRIIYR